MTIEFSKSHLTAIQSMDIDNAHTLPAFMYTDEEFTKIDQELLLAKHWQYIGHISQLQNTGDQIVASVCGRPVVVVKNKDGKINGFHNVCRHRAGPVATENGNSRMLSCKYHGWTYDLDGQLVAAPEMQTTPNFDICQFHLPTVAVSIWQGLVFVNITSNDPHSLLDIEEMLSGITETILPIDLSTLEFSHRDEYLIQCNWKTYMDNYLEGYHLPIVHPGLNKLLDYRSYEITTHPWYSYQFSPLENVNSDSNKDATNFYGEGKAHYFCIFPNLMLNILPNRLQTNLVIPVDANSCKVIFDYYYADLNSENTKALIKQDIEFSDEIQSEDIAICEAVQKGLASGTYESGRFCIKRENAVFHYQEIIRQELRTAIDQKELTLTD